MLVSIIIPVFNRFLLIGETIDSILEQTYTNWECIIVDDHSTDYTEDLINYYCEKDIRIKLYKRPDHLLKGANSCRNYGLEKSSGEFVQWFDSDDLMEKEALQIKVQALSSCTADYVISRSVSFSESQGSEEIISSFPNFYRFQEFKLSSYNYFTQNINWLTCDFFVRREFMEEHRPRFRENLKAHQERNFFCKITSISTNGSILDKVLSKVRIGHASIQSHILSSSKIYNLSLLNFFYFTWLDVKNNANKKAITFLFNSLVKISLDYKAPLIFLIKVFNQLLKDKKYSAALLFAIYQTSFQLTGRGLRFKKKFQEKLGY